MSVLVLSTTTMSIEAFLAGSPSTTQPPFVTAWADNNGVAFTEGELDGALNSANPVTIVAAPASGTRRIVRSVIIYNADTAAITVTMRINNNGTYRILYKQTISPGDSFDWPSGIVAYGIDPTLYALTSYVDGKVLDSIADADTTHSPSRNSVYDALALKAPLNSPALITPTRTTANSDNDSSLDLATTAFAKSQDAVICNPKAMAQGVAMTYAASGSSGITVADNDNIDFGTGNFTLVWKGSLPDWTPSVTVQLISKIALSPFYGYSLSIQTDGKIRFAFYRNNATPDLYPMTVASGFTDGAVYFIVCVVTRETSTSAGSVTYFTDGILSETIAIASAATITLNNDGPLNVLGMYNSGIRHASTTHHAITYNRALTAAEVLHNYRNGPKLEWYDPTGVSPATQKALTSGTLVTGKEYTIDTFVAGDDFANVGGTNATGNTFVATGTTPTTWANSSILRRTGITWGIMLEGMQPAPGQCFDFSGNKNHAMQPVAGSNLTRYKKDFEYRWTNTWTASSAAQYIGGLNQAVLSSKHFITQIITKMTVETDDENITIGDGSDADRFVTTVAPTTSAVPQVHTIARGDNDGTNLKLVITPAAEATMTIESIIKGIILE